MATTSFIPKLWSARLLHNLQKSHVALAFVNHDYEGEIRQMGDTVHINTIGAITVSDYVDGTDMEAPERLATADTKLIIDRAKSFNFMVTDIERVQAAGPLMDAAMQEAAYALADDVDTVIFKTISDGVKSANTISGASGAAIAITADNAYDKLVELRTKMTKLNVPSATWQAALPPEYIEMLLKDDRFVKAGVPQSEERLQNGFVGRAAGFNLYESNNLPSGVVLAAPAFATTFAEQIVETEALRHSSQFADIVRGLDVYGIKVVRDDAIAKLKVSF